MVAVLSSALLMTISNGQIDHSRTLEMTAEIQSQRLQEQLQALMYNDTLLVENTGTVGILVKEIRILDENGRVIHMQKDDSYLTSTQNSTIQLDSETHRIITQYVGGGT